MRLDRHDAYLTRFVSTVVQRREDDAGVWLALAESAFYPTSGGQPCDLGTLASARVVDVTIEAGTVWHRVEGDDLPDLGASVQGQIDWERRFRHMQRHTAQHLMSQALVRTDPRFETRSVSMTSPDVTIDAAGDPDAGALAAAEREANLAARQALPVTPFEVDEARLGEYALRRPAKVRGVVRLVAIGTYDLVACGGTHLRSTAEALPIKLLGAERVRGGLTRITFRAGQEAAEDYALKHQVTAELGRDVSARPAELPERVMRLRQDLADRTRAAAAMADRLAATLAQGILGRADGTVATAVLQGDDASLLDAVAAALQDRPGVTALLAATTPTQVRLLFLHGPDVDVDVRDALRVALEVVEGRGGGRPDRAAGAGTRPEAAAEALRLAAQRLREGGG